jgi:putative ABC transport system substrate-binding protein
MNKLKMQALIVAMNDNIDEIEYFKTALDDELLKLKVKVNAFTKKRDSIETYIKDSTIKLNNLFNLIVDMTRVAVLRDSANPAQTAQFGVIQAVAPMLKVEVVPIDMRDAGEIERAVETFARSPNGGLIVVGSGASIRYRDLIVTLAARHKLPAVYWERFFVVAGGLISYGAHTIDQYRRAAGYVDRILKGEKPADLPVQAPTKYEMTINLKTAKALGLPVPLSLQQRADEVIE